MVQLPRYSFTEHKKVGLAFVTVLNITVDMN